MNTTFHSTQSLSINGFDLYYEVHGQGSPLLLLHGFSGSGAALVQRFHALSATHQLIIPDLRGHGRSTNPSNTYSFKQAALDVYALLDHLGIAQCDAVGFSGGGCTLLHMAYQQAKRVKAMIIVSSTPYFPPHSREIMKQFSAAEKTEEEWAAMRSIHFHGDEQIQLIWKQVHALSENKDDMNFTSEMLSKIKTNTLIIQGDRDPIYPIELTIELYKGLAEAQLWIIPNGGHVPITPPLIPLFISSIEQFISS